MLETPTIKDYDTFIENLLILEKLAFQYAKEVPGKEFASFLEEEK